MPTFAFVAMSPSLSRSLKELPEEGQQRGFDWGNVPRPQSGGTGDENATPVPRWHGGGGDILLQPASSCARHIGAAPTCVNSAPNQRQWLLVKHRFNHDLARYCRIDPI